MHESGEALAVQQTVADGAMDAVALSPRQRRRVVALEEAFAEIARTRMADVPICNPALTVQAVGFRSWEEGRLLGALITPWFLNLIVLPGPDDDWDAVRPGTEVEVRFAAGPCGFLHAQEARVGPYLSCSLFSPVFEFADQEMAVQAAEAALQALLSGHKAVREEKRGVQENAEGKAVKEVSRRGFLRAVLGAGRQEEG